MKALKLFLIIILCFAVSVSAVMAAHGGGGKSKSAAEGSDAADSGSESAPEGGGIRLGGDYGKGTDPIHFNDQSLISTPVPTATPDIAFENQEKKAWDLVRNTRDLLIRCRTDLSRYEKSFRKEFNNNLNKMQKAVASLHTYAVLHNRDVVEMVWSEAADAALRTLSIAEEHSSEFYEDYSQMEKNQEEALNVLRKSKASIQQPVEIEKEIERNKKEMFFVKKKIDYFDSLFRDYAAKYNKTVDEREKRVAQLIKQHEDLHRP